MTMRASRMIDRQELLAPRRPGGRVLLLAGVVVAVYLWSLAGSDVRPRALADGVPGIADFVSRLFPPTWRMSPITIAGRSVGVPEVVLAIVETLQMALLGTTAAVVASFPIALLAARNTSPHRLVYQTTRLVLNLLRAIPELILALMFVAAVGLGPFAGVLALAFGALGFLGKQYAEAFEAIDPRPVLAVSATGANRVQTFLYGVVPQALPLVVSYSLLIFETNVRSATVLGIVGAGGVGFMLSKYMALFQYRELMGALLVIILVVTAIDRASDRVRKRLT